MYLLLLIAVSFLHLSPNFSMLCFFSLVKAQIIFQVLTSTHVYARNNTEYTIIPGALVLSISKLLLNLKMIFNSKLSPSFLKIQELPNLHFWGLFSQKQQKPSEATEPREPSGAAQRHRPATCARTQRIPCPPHTTWTWNTAQNMPSSRKGRTETFTWSH